MPRLPAVASVLLAVTLCHDAVAVVAPTAAELAASHAWVQQKILGESAVPREPGLLVLANNDPVQLNARHGRPLRLVDREFTRGLYCHAVSRIVVRLPGPAKSFSAIVGVDRNSQTSGGRGSVVFRVKVGEKEAWHSEVLREGMPAVPVNVDLGGADELTLEVGDGGDGISCDQADWAEACAELRDGRTIWLGALPLIAGNTNLPGPMLSFLYDGKPAAELLSSWPKVVKSELLDLVRARHTVTWTDPQTGLAVRLVAIEYGDYPVVEWTLHLRNNGPRDTPLLEQIQALDTGWRRGAEGEFLLHHNVGSPANRSDFAPLETLLRPGDTCRIAAAGGRSTNSDLSYFNLQWPGEGRIIAVGWPGQWATEWTRDSGGALRLRAGQELTHLKLLPGEEIRTPLIALLTWQGTDWVRSQNLWRRWLMAHSLTRPGGKLPKPAFRASSSRAYQEMIGADEANQIMHLDRYEEEKLGLDTWWMDAGWYVQEQGWPQVGTWEIDTKRFPRGFKPISDRAHAKGTDILVWFEPERVAPGTWLATNHPEWILGGAGGGLLNLGNAEARGWLVEHIDRLIVEQGIDLYRQDFNMDPLGLWRGNDAADRQGITEIRHVEGLLAYWDELRRRHPGMLIDTCASGGRRLDLETLRRAVPLWRSDYAFEPLGHQGMTYGLSMWLPYHGTGTVACADAGYYGGGKTPVEPYAFWSNAAPSISCGMDIRQKDMDWGALRTLLSQWRQVNACYYGDFYPLTAYSQNDRDWIGWQFDGPAPGEGLVQVFRRPQSPYLVARFPLRGLDSTAVYEVTRLEEGKPVLLSGRELLEDGLPLVLRQRPEAATVRYRAVSRPPAAAAARTSSLPGDLTMPGKPAAPPPEPPYFASPEVTPERRLVFRLWAPQAKSVTLSAYDLPGFTEDIPLAKTAERFWEVTVGPVVAGAYRYRFLVDGLEVVDPRNPLTSESNDAVWSLVYVPGSPLWDTREVPHGVVAEVTYLSRVLGRARRMHVYTPPRYERGRERYPVLYLLHGADDSDDSWSTVGRAGFILDNLLADGKAVPMIVVMPAGHTRPQRPDGDGRERFANEFACDIRPYIERHYRVRTDPPHRALAGLSMGGIQALDIACCSLPDYGYVGVFSSAVVRPARPGQKAPEASSFEQRHGNVLDDAGQRANLKLLWFATGKDDFMVKGSRASVQMLRKHGFEVTYRETGGVHRWLVWRRYLGEFAPLLFR